jgi:hypothetical protein
MIKTPGTGTRLTFNGRAPNDYCTLQKDGQALSTACDLVASGTSLRDVAADLAAAKAATKLELATAKIKMEGTAETCTINTIELGGGKTELTTSCNLRFVGHSKGLKDLSAVEQRLDTFIGGSGSDIADLQAKITEHDLKIGVTASSVSLETLNRQVVELTGRVAVIENFQRFSSFECTSLPSANTGVNLSPLSGLMTAQSATIGCSQGYIPATTEMSCWGDRVIRGTQPTCNPFKCQAQTMTFARAHQAHHTMTFPETISKTLNPSGYSVSRACPASHTGHGGSITMTCHANSEQFTQTGNCGSEKLCPSVTHSAGGTTFSFEAKVQNHPLTQTHNCPSGYTGSLSATCNAGSTSLSITGSCLRVCPALSTGTGFTGCSQRDESSGSCTQSCSSPYSGSATSRSCQSNGAWSGSAPSCSTPAPVPAPVVTGWITMANDHLRSCAGANLHWGFASGDYMECRKWANDIGSRYYAMWTYGTQTACEASTWLCAVHYNYQAMGFHSFHNGQRSSRRLEESEESEAGVTSLTAEQSSASASLPARKDAINWFTAKLQDIKDHSPDDEDSITNLSSILQGITSNNA